MAMATAQPCFSYDVFLSFRGEDTRKNFTDHLYTALNQAAIRTFRDDNAMERGKLLKPELEKAIKQSAISIIVFSEGYASSKWCLDEVLAIMKEHETSCSKHEVVPVFYKVEPSDVRNHKGSFKEAFDEYDDEIKAETDLEKKTELLKKVGAWRDSLRKAATLTGMVLVDGYESKFITDIVNDIKKKVGYKALYIEEKLVGIEDNVAKIELWLQDLSPNASILVIDGMGGVGKTTIAKCIYNSNTRNYDHSCFLANVDETSNQPGGLLRLQSQLLSTILKTGREETIWNVDEGTVKVTDAISNRKVLLILDDVATPKQLDALLGPKRFYPGSKMVITTRRKDLSTAFKVHPKVHSVETLSSGDAIELFNSYAFDQDQPTDPFIVQSELVVQRCKGLPLALKVLGSSLRGKTYDVWKDTICKLEAIPNPEIQKVLEISYETLADDKDKDLFLHVACFFVGEEKDYIVKLLAQCDLYPVVGINNLMGRCLLNVDQSGRVMMHELIKEMGQEVVRKESPNDPGNRSRLWCHQDCIEVLQDQTGTEKVKGLVLDIPEMKEYKSNCSSTNYFGKRMHRNNANFGIGALEKMKNLMLLQLDYVTFSGTCKRLPMKLRLLRWHGCTLKSIPSDGCLEKLVVLDMSYSKLKRVWDDNKDIGSLKVLNLSYCVELIKTPNFHGLPGLESLILKGCSSLRKVDESIAYLKELVLLDLSDCRNLREFPCLPTSLVLLQMSGCGRVQCFDSGPSLSSLVEMNISNCNLSDSSFTNDWSSFVALLRLYIDGNHVTSLPKCVHTLPKLGFLSVVSCSKLKSVLRPPESLRYLYGGRNESLEKVELSQNQMYAEFVRNYCPKLCEMEGRYKIRSVDKVERKIIRYLGLESNAGEGMEVLHGRGTFVSRLLQKMIRRLGLESNAGEGMELGLKVLHGFFGTFVSRLLQKVIRCLGLESNAGEGMELGLKVLHEFGIFSTCVAGKQIPSGYMYKERGPQISFQVPWRDDSVRVSGLNMCVVLSQSNRYEYFGLMIEVYNKTKDVSWRYRKGYEEVPKNVENYGWLSVWRCGNLLEAGDEIVISIVEHVHIIHEEGLRHLLEGACVLHQDVEECGIKLIYEADEGSLDGETKDVNASDQISWTDRMDTDISNYVYSVSGSHFFDNGPWPSYRIAQRIQLSTEPRTKWREVFISDRKGRLCKG